MNIYFFWNEHTVLKINIFFLSIKSNKIIQLLIEEFVNKPQFLHRSYWLLHQCYHISGLFGKRRSSFTCITWYCTFLQSYVHTYYYPCDALVLRVLYSWVLQAFHNRSRGFTLLCLTFNNRKQAFSVKVFIFILITRTEEN